MILLTIFITLSSLTYSADTGYYLTNRFTREQIEDIAYKLETVEELQNIIDVKDIQIIALKKSLTKKDDIIKLLEEKITALRKKMVVPTIKKIATHILVGTTSGGIGYGIGRLSR
jgi:hypothetical protein